MPATPSLGRDVSADVCIVGAGIAGLTTAYLLARAGRQVVVLDRERPGSGETGRTTAHLTCVLDERYAALERLHGEPSVRLAAASHAAAIDLIEEIVAREGIACGFERVDGYLFESASSGGSALEQELLAARRAGVFAELLPRAPISAFDTGPALRFPRQGQLHPLRYLAGLARGILQQGGAIYSDAQVRDVSGGPPASVTTERGHAVRCSGVVVAMNTPGNDRLVMHTKQAPYRSYVIAGRVPPGAVPRALYWDSDDPYHYVRLHGAPGASEELLIVGGEDHKTGQADDEERFARLLEWTLARFPSFEGVRHRWSGQLQEPADRLGFIGRKPGVERNVYVVTGTSGNGMTYGTLAGMLLGDLIAGRSNAWTELYDPARLTLRAAGGLLRQNLNVAAQYARHVTPEAASAAEIPRGGGAILRRGRHKLAVYRDPNGNLHELQAVCPHLGCIVRWNGVESSWDCPCHGSRFTADGRVLNGPALTALTPAPVEV
jgi:glycine/D-amino acid oxidase-like deaminating enzyme/nitrite reductase/ring-hydroxylating ferredoxin subunit